MAYYQEGNLRAGTPVADYSGKQGHAMVYNGTTLTLAATAGQVIDGILTDKPAWSTTATLRQDGTIQVRDVAKIKAGAAFSAGANLAVQVTTGRLIAATTGQSIVAKALEAATAADQLVAAEIGYRGASA